MISQIYMQFRQPPVVKVGQSRLKCFFFQRFFFSMFVSDALWLSGCLGMFSEANGSGNAGNNSRNATGPAAATSVDGLSESSAYMPSLKVEKVKDCELYHPFPC